MQPIRFAWENPGRNVPGTYEVAISLCVAGIGDDKALILSTHRAKLSAATGEATVSLEPNSTIDPAGTWYVARFPDGSDWTFTVPAISTTVAEDMTDHLVD